MCNMKCIPPDQLDRPRRRRTGQSQEACDSALSHRPPPEQPPPLPDLATYLAWPSSSKTCNPEDCVISPCRFHTRSPFHPFSAFTPSAIHRNPSPKGLAPTARPSVRRPVLLTLPSAGCSLV